MCMCLSRFDPLTDSVWLYPTPEGAILELSWGNVFHPIQTGAFEFILNQHRLACFHAAIMPWSGIWLNAVSSVALGTLLDGDLLCIALSH